MNSFRSTEAPSPPSKGGWSQACGPQPEGHSIPLRKPHPQASGEWLFVVVTCGALLLKRILVLRLAFEAQLVHGGRAGHVFLCSAIRVLKVTARHAFPHVGFIFALLAVLHPLYLPCELRLIQNTAVVLCKEKRTHLVSFFVWSLYLLINL